MAGTFLGHPFDEELFYNAWSTTPDPVRTAILESGVMVNDSLIASQIQSKGNFYTIPFYDVLNGTLVKYDGQTDITATETTGSTQSGVVYGFAAGFSARNFVAELTGSDPMGHIARSVGAFWNKERQKILLSILGAVFGITGGSGNAKLWQDNHTADLGSTTATAYTIGATDLNDLATQALGDNKQEFSLVIMHSNVAKTLENMQVLEFWKQTDANGLQRPTGLASMNGYTVVIDDNVPVETVGGEGANKDLKKYTTYLLGSGVLRNASARLDRPNDTDYKPEKNGGQEYLYTRVRETIHPNGFSFKIPSSGWTGSPSKEQLAATANWSIVHNPKAIPMARLITNG